MGRTVAALVTGLLAFLGLLTWEIIALGMSAAALLVALVAIVQGTRSAAAIRDLQEGQGVRLDALDERLED